MLSAVTFCFLNCFAQSSDAIAQTIISLEQKVVAGILEPDTNLLKKFWAEAFMVNTPRNNIAKGRAAVLEIQKTGLIDYSSFERIVEEIQVHKDIVITMGSETFVSRTDIPEARAGQPVKRRFTNVWMKENGNWMQVARHASIICSQ